MELLRAVESEIHSVPRAVREAYPRDELVNSVFVLLKSRRVKKPSRLKIKSAAIDVFRRDTHYPRSARFRRTKEKPRSVSYVEEPIGSHARAPETKTELADHLLDIRRRFGTDGLAVFMMVRVMEMNPGAVARVMDFEPDSALARSIREMGAEAESC